MLIPSAASAKFFHTPAGTGFVDLLINGNRETWPIRSKRFRTWLRRRHYEATWTAASAAAINSALDLFEAQAQFEGSEREVHVRLAEHAGHIYLDLADECWRAADIGPDGWRVIGSPPVRFRRTAGSGRDCAAPTAPLSTKAGQNPRSADVPQGQYARRNCRPRRLARSTRMCWFTPPMPIHNFIALPRRLECGRVPSAELGLMGTRAIRITAEVTRSTVSSVSDDIWQVARTGTGPLVVQTLLMLLTIGDHGGCSNDFSRAPTS
jgi:hypothetical protein